MVASTYLDALDISNKTANVVAEKQVVTVSISSDTPAIGDSYAVSMGGTAIARSPLPLIILRAIQM